MRSNPGLLLVSALASFTPVLSTCGSLSEGNPDGRSGDGSTGLGATCSASMPCTAGLVCSPGGHCVAAGGCVADPDCTTGQHCGTGSRRCLAAGACAQNNDCTQGMMCDAMGHCVPGSGCGGMALQASRLPPNIMILLDRSGSMHEPIGRGTETRWNTAKAAIQMLTTQFDTQARFGLTTYPACTGPQTAPDCTPGRVIVDVGDARASMINTFLQPLADVESMGGMAPNYLCLNNMGCTSTGASLQALVGNMALRDASRANAVLLMTDGAETAACTGGTRPNGATAAGHLYAQTPPVRTFAVGMSVDSSMAQLQAIATAGHTGMAYQATDPAGLANALRMIAASLASCDYQLAMQPEDPTQIYVFFNRVAPQVPMDPANGWTYDAATRTVHFHGTACTQITSGSASDVQIVFGCPAPIPG
jgi:hypothetical protein